VGGKVEKKISFWQKKKTSETAPALFRVRLSKLPAYGSSQTTDTMLQEKLPQVRSDDGPASPQH